MPSYELLTTAEEVDAALAPGSGRVLVLKHSLTCPISSAALREFQRFLAAGPPGDFRARLIEIQRARPASARLAEKTGVRHESPQAILLEDGVVRWHDSHWEVTADALAGALAEG